MIGIYIITNIKNNKYYVGKSINIEQRWKTHMYKLNSGTHENIDLQNDWDKYGGDNFTFKVLEVCSKNILTNRENHWIDIFNAKEIGYNFNNRKSNNNRWTKDTKKNYKLEKLMNLCNLYIKDNTIGLFLFDDICKYMDMSYNQLFKFLTSLKDNDFKKFNIYVHRNWDSCYEYVSFCKYDTDFENEVEQFFIDDISNCLNLNKNIV